MRKAKHTIRATWARLTGKTISPKSFLSLYGKGIVWLITLIIIALVVLLFRAWTWLPSGFEKKTWWDVLELLVVPLVLALAALWFNSSEKRREETTAEKRRQDEILRTYFDRIGQLLTEKDLRATRDLKESPVRDYAQVLTVTALRSLDTGRRNALLQFLRDAQLSGFILRSASLDQTNLEDGKLWDFDLRSVRFTGANLDRANLARVKLFDGFLEGASLKGAYLLGADIHGAVLGKCNLRGAFFAGSNLSNSNLSGSDLRETNFNHAKLDGAIFSQEEDHLYADLRDASLVKANLPGTHFSGVNLSGANFSRANLAGANLVLTDASEVDFSGADLSNAAFTAAKGLTEKQLSKAILFQTRMPSGILRTSQPEGAKATV